MSEKKSETLNEHFMEKSYNLKLKEEIEQKNAEFVMMKI